MEATANRLRFYEWRHTRYRPSTGQISTLHSNNEAQKNGGSNFRRFFLYMMCCVLIVSSTSGLERLAV